MPPEERNPAEDPFRQLETQLAALRATAKSLREDRPSWADNIFHPGRRARQEADFSAALAVALKDFVASARQTMAQQQGKLAELETQLSELRRGQGEITQLRSEQERLARQVAEAAALRERVEQLERDFAAGQSNLTNEFRERLQNLLDEQRVSIRQLALKASEDAVLSDRARRATELKLEELAKRLPPA